MALEFKPVRFGNQTIGYQLEIEPVIFFFGTQAGTRESLSPEYEYCFLKQVHGIKTVAADPSLTLEADAHYTTRATRALVVQTADCVPLLLASKNQVCAVHAGWKGVAANIVAHAVASFGAEPILWAAIGPHIGRESFQIGPEVEAPLRQAALAVNLDLVTTTDHEGRTHLDLADIVKAQLLHAALTEPKILEFRRDTKADPEFCSFRRDQASPGRNLSFVVLNA